MPGPLWVTRDRTTRRQTRYQQPWSWHETKPDLPLPSRICMAETRAGSGNQGGLLEPEEAHLQPEITPGRQSETGSRTNEIDELSSEATELDRIRTNYRRVTTSHTTVPSREPQSSLDHLIYSISKFWRLQVSVVVAHEHCRDHLGREYFISSPLTRGDITMNSSIWTSPARCPGPFPPSAGHLRKSSGTLTLSLYYNIRYNHDTSVIAQAHLSYLLHQRNEYQYSKSYISNDVLELFCNQFPRVVLMINDSSRKNLPWISENFASSIDARSDHRATLVCTIRSVADIS